MSFYRLYSRWLRSISQFAMKPTFKLRVESLEDRNSPGALFNPFDMGLGLFPTGRGGSASSSRSPISPTILSIGRPNPAGDAGFITNSSRGSTSNNSTTPPTLGAGSGSGTSSGLGSGASTGSAGSAGSGGSGTGITRPTNPVNPSMPTGPIGNLLGNFRVTTDNGFSATDTITNDNRPVVSGTARPNTNITVFVDGVQRTTVRTTSTGRWATSALPLMTDGAHTIRASNGGSTSWIVDTKAPTVRISAPEFATTSTPTVSLTINQNDTMSIGGQAKIDVDLNNDGDFTDRNETGFLTQMLSTDNVSLVMPALSEGLYRVRAQVMDLAGNVGISAVTNMQIDPNAGKIGDQQLLLLIDAQERFGDQTYKLFKNSAFYSSPGVEPERVLVSPLSKYIFDEAGRALVSVRATLMKFTDQMETDLKNDLGMQVVNKTTTNQQNMVTGWLKLDQLSKLTSVKNFNTAVLNLAPITRVGSVTSEGDASIKANQFRNLTGKDGSGVNVGILSDSVNLVGGGIAASVASGDLASVNVLREGPAGSADEGRAMAEIVHDVAPGAGILFRTASLGPTDFAQGIRDLYNAGARVITDDIGYPSSPFFNDGVISQAVDYVFGRGAVYTSAAGNDGDTGFRTEWVSTTATVGSVTGTFFTFGNGDVLQNMVASGGQLDILVQWDDSFLENGSGAGNFQVTTDIAVLVVGPSGNILGTIDSANATTDMALEYLSISGAGAFSLAYQLKSGPAPTRLAWIAFGSDPMAQGQGAPTSWGQPTAAGAIGTAAINSLDGTVEPFTSRGGDLEFLFDANGARLSTPEIRSKPDVAGPDNINNSFFGQDDPADSDAFPNFAGTSAAAPHVAAAAALLLSDEPRATNLDVFLHLQLTALDVGSPGFDDRTGAGLVQLTPIQLDSFPAISDQNETPDQASDLKMINLSRSVSGQSIGKINGWAEYDWYTFTTSASRLNIRASGSNGGPLEIHVFRQNNNLLSRIGMQIFSSAANIVIATEPGLQYYVEIKGVNTAPGVTTTGDYSLSIRRLL